MFAFLVFCLIISFIVKAITAPMRSAASLKRIEEQLRSKR